MSVNDELGTRMKEYYEQIPKTRLMRRTPVAIRIDGKAFHTFTRGFQKPFDKILSDAMNETMKYLCGNIQGCVLGYTQSDEITLILVDYKSLTSSAWFDYEVQKMCSIAASMATMRFNATFTALVKDYDMDWRCSLTPQSIQVQEDHKKYMDALYRSAAKGAMFDARVFNIPKEEVTNLIYWRQLDAIRNSIQMVGQANFSHKELQNKSCSQIKDMLAIDRKIIWDDYPLRWQRGTCCVKHPETVTCASTDENGTVTWSAARPHWEIDYNIPLFKDEGRAYIENLIYFEKAPLLKVVTVN